MSNKVENKEEITVYIEIPKGSNIKYELNKESGILKVDRVLFTSMVYPANYGFIPNTLSQDGDPTDILVLGDFNLIPGCTIACRPIGLLLMEDEAGQDTKILAVPTEKVCAGFENIVDITDVAKNTIDVIEHFFSHYKDLEKGKWVKLAGIANKNEAWTTIDNDLQLYKNTKILPSS